MLQLPLGWKKPQVVFVNSMSGLFHDEIPRACIRRVFDVMGRTSWHPFQVLTKRAERLEDLGRRLDWPLVAMAKPGFARRSRNAGRLGNPSRVSKSSSRWASVSRRRPTSTGWTTFADPRLISFQSLLAALGKLDLDAIHGTIVGGESGPKARPMNTPWVTEIRDQRLAARVPFFFKQWGGTNKKKAGRGSAWWEG